MAHFMTQDLKIFPTRAEGSGGGEFENAVHIWEFLKEEKKDDKSFKVCFLA